MSPRKLLLLTAVVFGLFAFIVFFERKMPTTGERQSKGDLHWDLPEDRVVSVQLDHDGSIVELVHDGDAWRLTRPAPYPADSFAASDLARQLAQLRRVGGDSSEARPEDYGLTKPTAKATIVWKDAGDEKKKSTRTIEFGIDIPGTDIAAARVAGQTRVLFVPASVAASVKKPASDYQSKDVFGGSTADVARLDLERGRGHLLLTQRDGIWWMEQPLKDLADADAASRLAGDLTALRVIDFLSADKDTLATWGLAPPLYRVMLSDAKGKATTAEFGSTRSDGNSVYGRREGQAFTVASSIVEEFSKEAEAFRETHLVRFDRAKASALEGTFGADSVKLARGKDGGWSAARQAGARRLGGGRHERDPRPEEQVVPGRGRGARARLPGAVGRDQDRRVGRRALGHQALCGKRGAGGRRLAAPGRLPARIGSDGRAPRGVPEGRRAAADAGPTAAPKKK